MTNIFDLYKSGAEFENSTKEVEIDIRGKINKFNIKPMGHEANIIYQNARVEFNTNKMRVSGDDSIQGISLENNTGGAILDVIVEHTIEFIELTNDKISELGARNKRDFIARALGKLGVMALFNKIITFTDAASEAEEDKIFDAAETSKNFSTVSP